VYGYLYFKTDNLWSVFLAHTVNNGISNVLFINTRVGPQSGYDFGIFTAVILVGYLLLIPVIRWVCSRLAMPEVKPWDAFREDMGPLAESGSASSNASQT
jgi:hypothetical protein